MKYTPYIWILVGLLYLPIRSQNLPETLNCFSFPSDSLFRYGKLENGFTYYLMKNDDPKNEVQLELIVKAGRFHEKEDQLEYAHLLEHLVAGKTKNFPDVKKFMKEVGGYSNASTSDRFTNYYARVPSRNKNGLKKGLQLLKDWAQGNEWVTGDIETQSAAILGEARTFDPYQQWSQEKLQEKLLENTGYKFYPNSERFKNLTDFKPDAFYRYYNSWYRPDLEAAIVVGNINLDSIENEIKQLFSPLESPKRTQSDTDPISKNMIHLTGENQLSVVNDPRNREPIVRIIHFWKNFDSPTTIKEYKKMLLQKLYTLMLASRASRLKEQYNAPFNTFSTNYGENFLPDRQLAAISMSINLYPKEVQYQKENFQRGIIAWKRMNTRFTEDELFSAKKMVLRYYKPEVRIDNSTFSKRLKSYFVFNQCALKPTEEFDLASSLLNSILLRDIEEFSLENGSLKRNTQFVFFKPENRKLPSCETFQKWASEIDTMPIKPMEMEMPILDLSSEVKIPKPQKSLLPVMKENMIGVSSFQLPHGVKVLLKPTEPRQRYFENRIYINAFRPKRIPFEKRQKYLASVSAPEILQYLGAGSYNKFKLNRLMKEQNLKLQFGSDSHNQLIYAESGANELNELFELFFLYLKKPRRDQKGFDAWKAEEKEKLTGEAARSSKDFITEKFNSVWYPEIPVMKMDDLEDLNLKEVFLALNDCFSGIENFTFIITGDFDKQDVAKFLANKLSGFPVNEKPSLDLKNTLEFPMRKIEKNLEYKNIDQVFTNLYFPVKVSGDLKTQIELQLVAKALHENIYDVLRDGCYSPRAEGKWMDRKNRIFAFHIQFDSAIGNEKIMRKKAMKVFQDLRNEGVDENWLKSTIKNEVNSFESRFNSFGYFNLWPDYLKEKLENGEDPVSGILNYGTLMEYFISREDINSAARKYMKEDHLQQFFGYPENHQTINGTTE